VGRYSSRCAFDAVIHSVNLDPGSLAFSNFFLTFGTMPKELRGIFSPILL
jgi:hypothetical protein